MWRGRKPVKVEGQVLRDVPIGKAPVEPGIEGVGVVRSIEIIRVVNFRRAVVNSLSPCISGLKTQSVTDSLYHVDLQRVIKGVHIPYRSRNGEGRTCRIDHRGWARREQQMPIWDRTSRSGSGAGANQRWRHDVDVAVTEGKMHAPGAYVRGRDAQAIRELPLDVQVPLELVSPGRIRVHVVSRSTGCTGCLARVGTGQDQARSQRKDSLSPGKA